MRKTNIQKINDYLAKNTRGYYSDEAWEKIHDLITELRSICKGFDLEIEFGVATYGADMLYKKWNFKISDSRKEVFGCITAHAAGTTTYPLSRYDISAYVN